MSDDAPLRPGERVGVVVMAYGTPATPDDVEAYYTHIRRGRPPTPEQLDNLQRRYDALGGTSTLARRTADQVAAIRAALEAAHPGRFAVTLGQKHAHPFIEDGVAHLHDAGLPTVVGVALAPHWSGFSVGQYQERVRAAAEVHAMAAAGVDRWHDVPAYRGFLANAVRDALVELQAETGTPPGRVEVVFTAHSLPERVLDGDPYPDELAASAQAVAAELGLERWSLAWQSAGATPEPWRGPDILEVLRDRAAGEGRDVDAVLVCAQGFVADHLEVAYDLDIEAAAVAAEVGLGFARTRTLNDDADVMAALAGRIAAVADAAFGSAEG